MADGRLLSLATRRTLSLAARRTRRVRQRRKSHDGRRCDASRLARDGPGTDGWVRRCPRVAARLRIKLSILRCPQHRVGASNREKKVSRGPRRTVLELCEVGLFKKACGQSWAAKRSSCENRASAPPYRLIFKFQRRRRDEHRRAAAALLFSQALSGARRVPASRPDRPSREPPPRRRRVVTAHPLFW